MKIKAYFANTVEAAVQRASQELGDEALLLGARPAPAESAKLGRYEVTFGIPGNASSTSGAPPADSQAPLRTGPVTSSVQDDLRALRRRMREVAAHQLGLRFAPSRHRAFAAHRREGVKERTAGLRRHAPLRFNQARNRRARHELSSGSALAAIHRRDEHN